MPRQIVIVGGPHTGKTTLSNKLKDDLNIGNVMHSTDDLIGLGWSEASEAASHWFSDEGDWIIEGVSTARALRKWLNANPEKSLDADVLVLDEAFTPLLKGQQSMTVGVHTVFQEIEPELKRRGARIQKLKTANHVSLSTMTTEATAKGTSEEDGKNTEAAKADAGTDTDKNQDAPKFTHTQADLDRVAAKTREEEKAKYQKAEAEAKRLAEEAKAKEQGEFQQLADSRGKELDELKPQLDAANKELKAYRSTVADLVAADLKLLPKEVSDISPAQYAEEKLTNPLDVLAWLPKGKALAEKLEGQPAKRGAKEDPRAKGAPGDGERDKAAAARARQAYRE